VARVTRGRFDVGAAAAYLFGGLRGTGQIRIAEAARSDGLRQSTRTMPIFGVNFGVQIDI